MITLLCNSTTTSLSFYWQNFETLHTPDQKSCSSFLRTQCQAGSMAQTNAVQFGMSYRFDADFRGGRLTNFEMDLGVFLASPAGGLGPFVPATHVRAPLWGSQLQVALNIARDLVSDVGSPVGAHAHASLTT